MVLIAFLLGLGSTNHQMSFASRCLPWPFSVFWHNHGRLLNWKSVAIVAGGLVVGVGLGAALQGLGLAPASPVAVHGSPSPWWPSSCLRGVAVAGTIFLLIGFSVQLLFVPIRLGPEPDHRRGGSGSAW